MYFDKLVEDAIKSGNGFAKPPHMHNTRYDRLRRKQFYYESKSHQASNNELREWYGDRIEPYLDKFFDYVDEGALNEST